MCRRALTILTAGLLLAFLPLPTLASDAAAERVPITDPALLEELGFPPEARGIYALPGALERLLGPSRAEVEPELLYGTADLSFTGVSAMEFVADRPDSSNITRQISTATCLSSNNTWSFASAQIPLPTGVSLEFIDFFAFDGNATHDALLSVWEVCQTFLGAPVFTVLDSISTVGTIGWQQRIIAFDPAVTVGGNLTCAYIARIRFSNSQNVCVNDISVSHVSAGWKRQISPAPGTATFDDVPTGHLFFQHIEALVDSGITSGCDADNFCPGAPLTRGQMAAFLAKALGLHWPG